MMMSALIFLQENGSTTSESTGAPCEKQGFLCEQLYEATDNETVSEIISWLLGTPLKILIIVVVAWAVNRWLRKKITQYGAKLGTYTEEHEGVVSERATERAQQRAATLSSLGRTTSTVVVWGIAFIMVLEAIGFGIVTIIASAGVAGLAIAFGAQSVVEDVLTGLFMIIEDQFGVGDRVDTGHVEGYIERVTLRTTVVRDPDGRVWHVPNSEIDRIANETQNWSRATVDMGVSYATDLRQASEVLEQAAQELANEDEWKDHVRLAPVMQGVQSLGDDAVMLRVATRIDPDQRRGYERALKRRLKEALDEAGIEMPNRQLDVWMRAQPEAA